LAIPIQPTTPTHLPLASRAGGKKKMQKGRKSVKGPVVDARTPISPSTDLGQKKLSQKK
jgi:hypothetical protein